MQGALQTVGSLGTSGLAGRARRGWFSALVTSALLLGLLAAAPAAFAQYSGPKPILKKETIFNAPATGCIGTTPGDHTTTPPPCPPGMTPKYDLQYAFGFTQAGKYGYFATGSNVPCQFPYWGVLTAPFVDDHVACEWDKGPRAQEFYPMSGDNYPVRLYRIDSTTDMVEDITPNPADYPVGPERDTATMAADFLTRLFPGGRAAVATPEPNGVIMFFSGLINNTPGSPAKGRADALAGIALDSATGRVIGAKKFTNLSDMRKGTVLNGHVYVAGRQPGPTPGTTLGGGAYKWVGTHDAPFSGGPDDNGFESVMELNFPNHETKNNPFHIGNYTTPDGNDHLIVLGSPAPRALSPQSPCPGYPIPVDPKGSRIWMSPVVPKTGPGLTVASDPEWKSIFSYADYDPDPVRGASHLWGYYEQFDGQLVVGSYSTPPFLVNAQWCQNTGRGWPDNLPTNFRTKLRDFINSEHGMSVFAIKNPGGIGGKQQVRVLYGDEKLPVYEKAKDRWVNKPNLLGQTPKLGTTGFGNPNNYYNWTWTILQGKLYMGTFDGSQPGHYVTRMGQQVFKLSDAEVKITDTLLDFSEAVRKEQGGDLVRLDSLNSPAALEEINGYANKFRYGTRSMFNFGDYMYAGTAGMANMDNGFSVVKLTPQTRPVGPVVRRSVGQRVLDLVVSVAKGAIPSQASPVTVRPGDAVDFRVRLRNNAPLPATKSRICVRLPRGFALRSNPGATVKGRVVCLQMGKVPARGRRTVVVHTVAAKRAERAVAVVTGSGTSLAGDPACATVGSMTGAFAEGASARGRGAQSRAALGPCPDLRNLSRRDELAMLNDFRVFAKPAVARVRVAARGGAPGGVTG